MRSNFQGSPVKRQKPYLARNDRLSAERAVELAKRLRQLGGEELFVRQLPSAASAGPAATALRRTLGTDFYVRRDGAALYARARKAGEPELNLRRLRMGAEWMTLAQAAEALGITQEWLRSEFLNTGRLVRYPFGTRVVVKTADVETLKDRKLPGGAITNRSAS